LQELRDEGFLFFSSRGFYTLNQVSIDVVAEDLPDDVLENAVDGGRLAFSDVQTSSDVASGRVRRGMGALRSRTLLNYRGCCAVCDIKDSGLLVTSHIARWADRPEARGLLSNTICFCTFHDKLFENGYFAMSHDFDLVWRAPQLSRAIDIWQRKCTGTFRAPTTVQPDLTFINEHRQRVAL
jgi:putative restriction endonuclease